MRIAKSLFVLLGSLLCFANGFAQLPYFKHIDIRDGLPGSEFYDLKQDEKGLLWIAGNQGLTKYDGYKFVTYGVEEGLPEENIVKIFPRNNKLYFLTLSGQLGWILGDSVINPLVNSSLLRAIGKKRRISSFVVDAGDTVWIGLINTPYFLKLVPNGNTYALNQINTTTKLEIKLFKNNQIVYSSFVNASINKVKVIGSNQQISVDFPSAITTIESITYWNEQIKSYLSINNQIYYFSDRKLEHLRTQKSNINSVNFTSHNELLMGMTAEGLVNWPKGIGWQGAQYFLPDKDITSIITDYEDGIWCATLGNGIYHFPNSSIRTFSNHPSLQQESFTVVFQQKNGVLLAGSSEGHLYRFYNNQIDSIDLNLNSYTRNQVNYIFESKDGYLWASTQQATFRLDNDLKNIKLLRHSGKLLQRIKSFVESSDGLIWAGGNKKLYEIENTKDHIMITDVPINMRINAMAIDKSDKIWLGCNSGLWVYNERFFKFLGFGNKQLKTKINSLEFDKNGKLWVATSFSGVLQIDGNNVTHFSRFHNLTDNHCNHLTVGGNQNVWVSTNKGLSEINGMTGQIKKLTIKQGLPVSEIVQSHATSDIIWLATSKGLIQYKLKKEASKIKLMPTSLISITMNDKPVAEKSNYFFRYFENNLELNFLNISFINQGKVRYRYILEGADKHWNTTIQTQVRYADLKSGQYKFIVQAEAYNGEWGKDKPQFNFTIETPFWKRWWFVGILLLLTSSFISLLIWLRIRSKHTIALEKAEVSKKLVDLELQALRAQMNPHFIFNCINSIQHYILNSKNDEAHKYLSKFAKLMRNVLDNSKVPTITLEKELQTLELYMELESLRFEESFSFKIEIAPTIDLTYIEIPSMLIQPYVENAIWHGLMHKMGPGVIIIKLEDIITHVKCSIIDNGIGRDKAKEYRSKNRVSHKSVGMMITKERLEILNKINKSNLSLVINDLKDENGNSLGTKVEIFVPIN